MTFKFGGPRASAVRPAHVEPAGADNWAVDASSPATNDGTVIDARLWNAIVANLRTLLSAGGVTGTAADDALVATAVQNLIDSAVEALFDALADKLPLVGGTLTGDLTIDRNSPSGNPTFSTDSPAATYQGWIARRNGTIRWAWYLAYGDAESGSNAGTSARLLAYSDTGTFIGTALAIKRATLDMGIGHITPLRRLHPLVDDAINNAVTQVARLTHTTSGTPANGIGVGAEFEVETTAGNKVGAAIEAIAIDVTSASEDFDLVVKTMIGGAAAAEVARFGALNKFTKPFYGPEATLSDAANIDWNAGVVQNAKVTLGGNRTLNAPTGMVAGQDYHLRVIQDGTGSRTLTWNAAFKFGSTPTLQTTAGASDVFVFYTDGTYFYGKHLNEVPAAASASTDIPRGANLLPDAGRFCSTNEAKYANGLTSFVAPPYLSLYNSSTIAGHAKHINDTSTYGGAAAAIDAEVKELVDKIRASDAVRRNYLEFWTAKVTKGAGTALSRTPAAGGTYYLASFLSRMRFQADTVHFYIKAKTGNVDLHPRSVSGTKCYIDGVLASPSDNVLTPADGWKSVLITTAMTSSDVRNAVMYQPEFFYLYQQNPGDEFLIAMLTVTTGVASFDKDIGVVPNTNVWESAAFSGGYGPSSDQTITAAGALTLAHGLGVAPTLVQLQLKCITAELNYSVGDLVEIGSGVVNGTDRSISVVADATNINIRFGASLPSVPNKTTGAGSTITAANWKLVARAWK